MPVVELAQPKSRIEEDGAILRIAMPSPKNWFVIAFTSVWLIGFLCGGILAGGFIASAIFSSLSALRSS